jgi:hypothetical protein
VTIDQKSDRHGRDFGKSGKLVLRRFRLSLEPRDDDQLPPRYPVAPRQLVGVGVYVARDASIGRSDLHPAASFHVGGTIPRRYRWLLLSQLR